MFLARPAVRTYSMSQVSVQKLHPKPFPMSTEDESSVFNLSSSIGLSRTKSAPQSLPHVGSMPNLHNLSSLLEVTNDDIDKPPTIRAPPPFTKHYSLGDSSPESVARPALGSPQAHSSFEAPARINGTLHFFPLRMRANSITYGEESLPFCSIDPYREEIISSDLPSLVLKADGGMKSGVDPKLAEDSTGGSYFLRDKERKIQLVFKPSDEEANAPNNPFKHSGVYGAAFKGRIVPGFGMYRELAAHALDAEGFAGVPPTDIAKVRSGAFYVPEGVKVGPYGYKLGSVQSYVRSECSAEEMGCSKFDAGDVHRIAILDIRICNLDRHAGNMLVSRSAPYQTPRPLFPLASEASTESLPSASSAPASSGSLTFSSEDLSAVANPLQFRLIPIDHGFCLPHVLQLSDATFEWLHWPQVKIPLSDEVKSYIARLDSERDCAKLRRLVGAAIPETSLLSLKICTQFLQLGVCAGLTLYEIGMFMIVSGPKQSISKLQMVVNKAIRDVVAADVASRALISLSPKRVSPPTVASPVTRGNTAISDDLLRQAMAIAGGRALDNEIKSSLTQSILEVIRSRDSE